MWKVFTVKSLYRISATGTPQVTDENYRSDIHLIEERIVTIKARTFDEAISKGEKEAIKYASETDYLNPYGQKVTQVFIGSIDAFEPFVEIEANLEVFSSTYIISSMVSNNELTDNMMGVVHSNESELRINFLNCEFFEAITKC